MTGKRKIFVSSLAFGSLEEAIAFCKDNSIYLEMSKYARADNIDRTTKEELNTTKKLLEDNNITLTALHGACFTLCPSSLDRKIVEVSELRFRQSIEIARHLGASVVVFHTGYNSHIQVDSYKNILVEKQTEFWKNFIDRYEVNDMVIALENTYEEDPLILKKIYEGVNSDNFKCCIDIGHVSTYSNYDIVYWINTLHKYLHHFHLHNNNGTRDQHNSLLNGKINFEEFFQAISNIDKPLNLTLEIFKKNEVIESLEYVRKKFPL